LDSFLVGFWPLPKSQVFIFTEAKALKFYQQSYPCYWLILACFRSDSNLTFYHSNVGLLVSLPTKVFLFPLNFFFSPSSEFVSPVPE
jgi:hypothetical protein